MRGADAESRQRERPRHRRSRPRRPRSASALALGGALCALLCLSASVRGTADVPLSQWCAEAGIGGADAKFAAEGFHTLAEVVEAELSAADLAEIGLDDAQAKLFFRAFAGGGGGEGEGGDSSLRSWLGELGIEEAYSNFEAEGFTTLAEVVEAELTDDDLKELGLRLKARKLVKIELEKLPEVEPAGAPAPGPTPARKPASKPAAPEKVTEMPKIQMDDIIMLPNGGQMVGKEAWGTIIQTAVRRPKVTSLEMLDEAVQEHSGFAAMAEESSILFAGPDGTEITDIEQAKLTGPPPRLYARPEEDHWVWPGVEVGHKELVQLPVNEFYSLDGPSSVSEDPEGWSAPAPVDLEAQAAARAEAEQQEAELAAQRKKAAKSCATRSPLPFRLCKPARHDAMLGADAILGGRKRARRKEKKRKEKASKAKAKELEEREGSDVGTAPFTVETLSLQPKVLRVRNFISRAEAAALRRMGEDAELEERLMQGPPGCEDSPAGCDVFRNETASWLAPSFGHWSVLPPYGAEPLLAGVRRRLSTLLRIDPALMEATTISRMQAGNHHWSHHDFHTAMVTQDPLDLGYFDDVRRESPCAFAQHLRLIAVLAMMMVSCAGNHQPLCLSQHFPERSELERLQQRRRAELSGTREKGFSRFH